MKEFNHYANGNLAREVNRLHDWSGPLWERRYRPIPVSDEELAQVSRLKYIPGQGCLKEGLIASPPDWPGVTSAHELYSGHRPWSRLRSRGSDPGSRKVDVRDYLPPADPAAATTDAPV